MLVLGGLRDVADLPEADVSNPQGKVGKERRRKKNQIKFLLYLT